LCSRRTEEGDEVDDVKALELELGDDGGEGVVGGRDVVVGALDAGAQRVPPAQRHDPPWSSGLHKVAKNLNLM
jgi:hypothetical protein